MCKAIVNQYEGRRAIRRKRPLLLLVCLIPFLGLIPPVVCAAADAALPELRIGVVYRTGDTGNRILSGVNHALESYLNKQGDKGVKFRVVIEKYPYLDEKGGEEKIKSIFKNEDNKSIHLILGPSDSGVFVKIAELSKDKTMDPAPVVSSLVTSQEGNSEGDWRFRTNVDTEARARAVSDYLNRVGYQAVGVLYRDNEFGKHAAETFKSQLSQSGEDYLALP
jgi:ABC-type branched-subunit amino acid transport system substrate-binding protein